jgi:urease accessory protein
LSATPGDALALLRCLQLSSPGLPIGAYAYSQGLEWAVEAGWVHDEASLRDWIREQMGAALAPLDVAVYARLYRAVEDADEALVAHWNAVLLAHRETSELRSDDRDRGAALLRLLREFGVAPLATLAGADVALAAVHAQIAVHWALPLDMAVQAYVWAWLEGQVIAGVKLIPLGQAAGQRLLCALAAEAPDAVAAGLALADDDIGGALPALAIASCRHETQYTRLFRS